MNEPMENVNLGRLASKVSRLAGDLTWETIEGCYLCPATAAETAAALRVADFALNRALNELKESQVFPTRTTEDD